MEFLPINADGGPDPSGGYSQAVLVKDASRLLFISGQSPVAADGLVPQSFDAQARLVWANIERQLKAAGMGLRNIVKHTTYLARRQDRDANSQIRQQVLGDANPALTVVIAGIYDEAWLLEVEAIAAA